MNGHFSSFRNRLKIRESRKNDLRTNLRSKKERLLEEDIYLDRSNSSNLSLTSGELEALKKDIRIKIKKEGRVRLILTIFVIILIALFFITLAVVWL